MKKFGIILVAITLPAGTAQAVIWSGGEMNWTEPDSNSWDSTYTSNAIAQFGALGAGAVVVTNTGVNPAGVIINAGSYTFSGGSIGGTGTVTKSGSGTLTLSVANSYSGGTVINAGTLDGLKANSLGTGVITFAGSGTLVPAYGNSPTLAQSVTVNPGVTATFEVFNQYYYMALTNPVAGSGNLTLMSSDNGRGIITLSSAANSLSGTLQVGAAPNAGVTLTVYSWADSANPVKLYGNGWSPAKFILGAGTASPLLFNSRQIELPGSTTYSVIDNNNSTATNTITINTALLVSGAGAKTLQLGGSNTGTNTFGGAITNGASAVISLTKADGGTWILSGTNSYTGGTTISGGKLIFSNAWSVVSGNLAVTAGNKVRLDYVGTRAVAGLTLGGTNQSPGVYNSSNSPTYIEGAGNLITGIQTFSVTYNGTNATGGTVPVDWNAYTNGQTVTVMGTGTLYKTKSVFRGWATQPDGGGIRYSQGSDFVITNNTELYPRWNAEGTLIVIR